MTVNEAADSRTPEGAPPPKPTWLRYVKIGVPLVLVLGILILVFWSRIEIGLAINGLHAGDPEARRAHIERLKTHPERELVIGSLTDAAQDDGKAFDVRVQCVGLLNRHFNRLGVLEGILRKGSLSSRAVVLTVLGPEPFFAEQIAGNPDLRVSETLLDWLRQDGDMTRMHAVQLAKRIELLEALPLIRPLVRRSARGNVQAQNERDLMISAASALVDFKDCDSLAALLPLAKSDEDPLVRLRFMQVLDRGVFQESPPAACPGSADETAMQGLVTGALDDPDKAVRMGALLILGRRPRWADPAAARVQEILDGQDRTGAERRHALEVQVQRRDPAFLERFPLYFHDVAAEVRSTAARAVAEPMDQHFEGCWIGLITEEKENQLVFTDALDYLYRFARERVGFPPVLRLKAAQDPAVFRQVVADLFGGATVPVADSQGNLEQVSRQSVADASFRWWCKHRGVAEADVEQAMAARTAFYEAKARGDADAARAALDGMKISEPQGLFAYERGWLLRN